jgi:hypothetical protein
MAFHPIDLALTARGAEVWLRWTWCTPAGRGEFVAGARDDCVEVQSPAFTGTSYDGSSTGAGQPTTLGDVLDRWQTINGGTDWQVDIPGAGIWPIGGAISQSFGLVFNVKAFGAVGNGVANDTNAINAAIAAAIAAGGGLVYFPPGTYRTTGGHVVDGRVSLLGAGPGATTIVLDNPAAVFAFHLALSPSVNRFHVIRDFAVSGSTLAPGAAIFDIPAAGCCSIFYNLHLDGANFGSQIIDLSASSVTEILCGNCIFRAATAARAISVAGSSAVKRIALRDCKFITPAAFTSLGVVRSASLDVQNCIFDNSLTTSGTYSCLETSGTPVPAWSIAGCQFLNPGGGGATVTAMNWASYGATASVTESDNVFGSNVTAYFYTVPSSRGAQIHLRSRELRSIFITDNSVSPALPVDQYGMVVFSSNSAAPVVFQAAKLPPDGARGTIICYRPLGAAAVNVTAGVNFLNAVSAATSATGAYLWEYRVTVPNAAVRMALVVDGRNLGTAV